jgi:alpha-tubulin suppressor-like RCC1 family protein
VVVRRLLPFVALLHCEVVQVVGAWPRDAGAPSRMDGTGSGDTWTVYTGLRVGDGRACATAMDRLYCWGAAVDGAGGVVPRPTLVHRRLAVRQVALGRAHTCVLAADGLVWCWGSNAYGQLGNPSLDASASSAEPLLVQGLTGVQSVSAGAHVTCARQDDQWRCWGAWGNIGLAEEHRDLGPRRYAEFDGASELAAGRLHLCGLWVDGGARVVRCIGYNDQNVIDRGAPVDRRAPVEFSDGSGQTITDVDALSVGDGSTCVLYADHRRIHCRGAIAADHDGQPAPGGVEVPVGGAASTVSVGLDHGCYTDDRGGVWCWGYNTSGQLGDGSRVYRQHPVAAALPAEARPIEVRAGRFHTCARAPGDQTIWCWGDNTFGQLGDGTVGSATGEARRDVPVPVLRLAVSGG